MTYSIKLEGGERLIALLKGDKLLAKPIKNVLKAVGQLGKAEARARAPRKTGALIQSIGYRVSSKPRWVAIRVGATRSGFSYPRLLEFSGKHHHRGWLKDAMNATMGRLTALLNDGAREIEAVWRSRHA